MEDTVKLKTCSDFFFLSCVCFTCLTYENEAYENIIGISAMS